MKHEASGIRDNQSGKAGTVRTHCHPFPVRIIMPASLDRIPKIEIIPSDTVIALLLCRQHAMLQLELNDFRIRDVQRQRWVTRSRRETFASRRRAVAAVQDPGRMVLLPPGLIIVIRRVMREGHVPVHSHQLVKNSISERAREREREREKEREREREREAL